MSDNALTSSEPSCWNNESGLQQIERTCDCLTAEGSISRCASTAAPANPPIKWLRRERNLQQYGQRAWEELGSAYRRIVYESCHHIAEHVAHGIKALGGSTDVVQPHFIQQNLLYYERGDRLGQLQTRLHDAQAQRNDFCRQQKVNYLRIIHLDQSADDAQARQSQVLERASFACGVEERVQEERHVRVEEQRPGIRMRRDALQQRKCVAHPIGRVRRLRTAKTGAQVVSLRQEHTRG